ncbi:MAG: hypothetical protein EXQ91_00190 [Alphaproteobacteria bacterium]|nr:hypothetical protein [Alphaproteobacteria bacterium]
MSSIRRHFLLAWLFAATHFLVGCTGSPFDTRSDLELTWDKAFVTLPTSDGSAPVSARLDGRAFARWTESQGARRSWPVIVYLHGCTGFGNFELFERLAREGYLVIAPDSFARRFRPLQCDPKTQTGGYNLFVYDFRLAEIAYALQRLGDHPWVDRSNIFLMGASEGGVATALYRGDEIRARVITQWTCTGRSNVRGIAGPTDRPVLAIVSERDPWYDSKRAPSQRGHCGDYMADRAGSRSLVVNGETHDIHGDAANVDEIVRFLGANRMR